MVAITGIDVQPIGAPPTGFGGDARNIAQGGPTYANAVLEILTDHPELRGTSVIFTNGHGLKEMCEVTRMVANRFLLQEDWLPAPTELHKNGNLGRFCKRMLQDSDYSWLGGVGVSRMAIGAVANALWDLSAKIQQVPAWQLIVDMEPRDLLEFIDFEPIGDVLSPAEALDLLQRAQDGKQERVHQIYQQGLLAYNTAGWSGISKEGLVDQTRKMLQAGWPQIKIKVGASYSAARMKADEARTLLTREDIDRMALEAANEDAERMILVYQTIEREDPRPDKMKVAIDSNQVFDTRSAFIFAHQLGLKLYQASPEYRVEWFEEPCNQHSPMAHVELQQALDRAFEDYAPPLRIPISTGEQGASPTTFKDLLHAPDLSGKTRDKYAIDVVQMDYSRVGGIGDNLAILLMAQKAREEGRDVRICPHTGGIGLCEGMRNVQAIKQAWFGPDNLAGVPDILEFVAEEERSVHEGVFTNPAIVKNGYYQMGREPGVGVDYSARGKQDYTLPGGDAWLASDHFAQLARKFMQEPR